MGSSRGVKTKTKKPKKLKCTPFTDYRTDKKGQLFAIPIGNQGWKVRVKSGKVRVAPGLRGWNQVWAEIGKNRCPGEPYKKPIKIPLLFF